MVFGHGCAPKADEQLWHDAANVAGNVCCQKAQKFSTPDTPRRNQELSLKEEQPFELPFSINDLAGSPADQRTQSALDTRDP
jgi:hypothetical protein